MKKKSLLISVLVLGASAMMLTGFDSAATAEDVFNKYMEASKVVKQANATMDMNAQIGMSMSSETSGTSTLSMGAAGNFDMAFSTEPLSVGMTGSMKVDALGAGQSVEMQMYLVPDDNDGYDSYVYTNDGTSGEWAYEAVPAEAAAQINELLSNPELMNEMMKEVTNFDFSQMPGTLSLGDAAVDVNGTSCYQLVYTLTYDDIKPLFLEAMSASGEEADEEFMAMADAILSGLVCNIEIDIADDTYHPTRLYMDMAGSDLTGISQLISMTMAQSSDDGSMTFPEISLDINSLYVEAIYDYDSPVEITVPADALLAKKTGGDTNISAIEDTLNNLEEAAESELEN